jgi:hypothetical protein
MGLGPGAAKDVIGLEGVVPTGDGHVICHNRIEGFSDGISFGGIHQAPDGTRLSGPNNSVDVYGNEISTCLDDGIELDWGRSNIRCFGNRVTNALKGVSCQPTWGGPVYIVRNAIVNVQSFLKFHCEPVGMVILHNTAFAKDGWAGGEWHHAVMRNTVIASAASPVLGTRAHNADFDFNGYILAPKAQYHFHLGRAFKTLEEYQREMGLDRHSLILTPTDFVKAELTDASRKLAVGEMDLRLKPDSRAVDAGETLPNISDGFAGRAPDLGCYEAGQPLPYYGPRE